MTENWKLVPAFEKNNYVNTITKLLFLIILQDKHCYGVNLLKVYYKNLIRFKLVSLRLFDNQDLNDIQNAHVNSKKQILK
jgi:hypothetical protein